MTRNAKNRPNVLTLNCGPPDRGLRLSGAPLAAHPIMPVQVARRRANSRCGSRLGRREKRGRTANFNGELAAARYVRGALLAVARTCGDLGSRFTSNS